MDPLRNESISENVKKSVIKLIRLLEESNLVKGHKQETPHANVRNLNSIRGHSHWQREDEGSDDGNRKIDPDLDPGKSNIVQVEGEILFKNIGETGMRHNERDKIIKLFLTDLLFSLC